KTSPCSSGFIVPGSTLMYGSSFCIVTRRPRHLRSLPSDDAVRPLPSELATPPVTKMCLQLRRGPASFATGSHPTSRRRPSRGPRPTGHRWLLPFTKTGGGGEELVGVLSRRGALGLPRQHTRQLDDARLAVEDGDVRNRAAVAFLLG